MVYTTPHHTTTNKKREERCRGATFPSRGTNAGCVSAALAASSSGVIRVSGTMVSSRGVRGIVMAEAMTSAT